MNTQSGTVWKNAGNVTRHSGPHADPTSVIDTLPANQSVIVLCWSHGDNMTFANPFVSNTSDAWDFVVTSDQDPGGFVADVFINTVKDIRQQLPVSCDILAQRLLRLAGGQLPAIG
jgi:hypothetical protein